MMEGVLSGHPGPARDIVLLNAGAALYVSGLAENIGDGVTRAAASIDSGAARGRLDALAALSRRLMTEASE
jgi:anthranilate phosphoribosyltransferase